MKTKIAPKRKRISRPTGKPRCQATIFWKAGRPTRHLQCVHDAGHLGKHLAADGQSPTTFEWEDPAHG